MNKAGGTLENKQLIHEHRKGTVTLMVARELRKRRALGERKGGIKGNLVNSSSPANKQIKSKPNIFIRPGQQPLNGRPSKENGVLVQHRCMIKVGAKVWEKRANWFQQQRTRAPSRSKPRVPEGAIIRGGKKKEKVNKKGTSNYGAFLKKNLKSKLCQKKRLRD